MRDLAQCTRDFAFHHHGQIMPRAVDAPADTASARIDFEMVAGVPPLVRHVDAAAHSEFLVENGNLLVVRTAERVRVVQFEMDAAVSKPAEQIEHHGSADEVVGNADPPLENTKFEPLIASHKPAYEAAQS